MIFRQLKSYDDGDDYNHMKINAKKDGNGRKQREKERERNDSIDFGHVSTYHYKHNINSFFNSNSFRDRNLNEY